MGDDPTSPVPRLIRLVEGAAPRMLDREQNAYHQDLRTLVADRYLDWRKHPVPPDVSGQNAGWCYAPPHGLNTYSFPPRGAISPYLFTPCFEVLKSIDEVERLRAYLPFSSMITVVQHTRQFRVVQTCMPRPSRDRPLPAFTTEGAHIHEHIARLLALLQALIHYESHLADATQSPA